VFSVVQSLLPMAVLVMAGTLMSPAGVESAQSGTKKKGEKGSSSTMEGPILITADSMEVDRKKNLITYKGRVVTVRGEMKMQSESLTATYDQGMKRIKEVIAEGEVHVIQGARIATGAKAKFNGLKNTITLTGNPTINQGKSRVSGSRIILFINEDRGVVEGGSQRVKVVIFPEELKK